MAVAAFLWVVPARLRDTRAAWPGPRASGNLTGQLTEGALLASASSLPTAAAIVPAGTPGLWGSDPCYTIGPRLLVTGSVARLIIRRIARDGAAWLSARQFSTAGLALVPVRLAAATLGLHIAGLLN